MVVFASERCFFFLLRGGATGCVLWKSRVPSRRNLFSFCEVKERFGSWQSSHWRSTRSSSWRTKKKNTWPNNFILVVVVVVCRCRHCQHMVNEWVGAAQEMDGEMEFGAVNGVKEQGLLRQFEVAPVVHCPTHRAHYAGATDGIVDAAPP